MRRMHPRHAGLGHGSSGDATPHPAKPKSWMRSAACSAAAPAIARSSPRFRMLAPARSLNRRPWPATRWARGWCGWTVRARLMARRFLAPTKFPPELWWSAPFAVLTTARAFSFGDLEAFVAAHPGIHRVLTAKDVPGENRYGVIPRFADQPVFAETRSPLSRRSGRRGGRRGRGHRSSRPRKLSGYVGRTARADHDCGRARA